MAREYKQRDNTHFITFTAASTDVKPATFSVGDPVLVGFRPGIAMTNRTSTSTSAVVAYAGVMDTLVTATAAMDNGEVLYFATTASSAGSHLTNASSGNARWGYIEQGLSTGSSVVQVSVGI